MILLLFQKTRFGYRLSGNILKENEIFNSDSYKIPITSEERQIYLIDRLISEEGYIKLEDIAEKIYISVKTLSNDIKKIEKIIRTYNWSLKENHIMV
ncbi:Probable licABCH operon regulator [Streptobacillus moniliformis]|nr:Probable licABCH operon regulator [Streptobacillus moniliformis]